MPTHCLYQDYLDFLQPNYGKDPNIHGLINGKEDVYIYNGILLSHKKEGDITICNDVGGAREYNAK